MSWTQGYRLYVWAGICARVWTSMCVLVWASMYGRLHVCVCAWVYVHVCVRARGFTKNNPGKLRSNMASSKKVGRNWGPFFFASRLISRNVYFFLSPERHGKRWLTWQNIISYSTLLKFLELLRYPLLACVKKEYVQYILEGFFFVSINWPLFKLIFIFSKFTNYTLWGSRQKILESEFVFYCVLMKITLCQTWLYQMFSFLSFSLQCKSWIKT